MNTFPPAIQAALEEGTLVLRDFFWLRAKDRETGEYHDAGFHSGLGTLTVTVVDAITRTEVDRVFVGGGVAFKRQGLQAGSGLTIRTLQVGFSQIDQNIANSIRLYDAKRAPCQLYVGVYAPTTKRLVSAAYPLFVGFVDQLEVKTPRVDEPGSVDVTCVSQMREGRRGNPDVRSGASQRERNPSDTALDYAQNMKIPVDWGKKSTKRSE